MENACYLIGVVMITAGAFTESAVAASADVLLIAVGRIAGLLESLLYTMQYAAYGAKPGRRYNYKGAPVIACWNCKSPIRVPELGRTYTCNNCEREVGIIR